MSIDLPPPLTPEPGSALELRNLQDEHPARQLDFSGYRLHLIGEPLLETDRIASALAEAVTLSDAVRMIAWLHYVSGYPAVQLRYALIGAELYLLILPGRVESVGGDPELRPYFLHLVDEPVLTAVALEPARSLAAMHAQRSGQKAQLGLLPGRDPGSWRLYVDSSPDGRMPVQARLEAGNPGNRFVGRDFGEAELALRGGAGELRLLYRESLGAHRGGSPAYRDLSLASGFVSLYGLFTIEARSVEYRQRADAALYTAEQSNLGLSWTMLPYADFATRWLLSLRIDDTGDRMAGPDLVVLDQDYPSLEVALSRASAGLPGVWSSSLELGLAARLGLRSGPTADAAADRDFQVYLPSASLKLARSDYARWSWGLELSGQLSAGRLPQQHQYVLGGNGSLTAWLPGVMVGDEGHLLRAQSEWTAEALGLTLTPRVFAEFGGIADRDQGDGSEADWLADAGIELAVQAGPWLNLSVAAAVPLAEDGDRAALDEARAEVYFRIALRY